VLLITSGKTDHSIEKYSSSCTQRDLQILTRIRINSQIDEFLSVFQKRLRLFNTSKPQICRAKLFGSRPHFSIIDNDVGAFFIDFCRRPPIDHLGMGIPQRRLFVRVRFVGGLSKFRCGLSEQLVQPFHKITVIG
jgi:hypothetical protein